MKQLIGRIALAVLVAAACASFVSAADGPGRYKKDGNKCVWDANDDGPNQCTPVTEGRFKLSSGACVWASERGANQCTPKQGRFKKDGDRCYWDAKDSGPNQCDPKAPK